MEAQEELKKEEEGVSKLASTSTKKKAAKQKAVKAEADEVPGAGEIGDDSGAKAPLDPLAIGIRL